VRLNQDIFRSGNILGCFDFIDLIDFPTPKEIALRLGVLDEFQNTNGRLLNVKFLG
jgi:hypothetical protein